jgi:hypothetical protein
MFISAVPNWVKKQILRNSYLAFREIGTSRAEATELIRDRSCFIAPTGVGVPVAGMSRRSNWGLPDICEQSRRSKSKHHV